MSDRERLLHRVCLAPDDDTPRLIYADWRDEHGEQERAEFIRVQIEADKLDRIVTSAIYAPGPPQNVRTEFSRLCELRQRERELKDVLRLSLWAGEQPADMAGSGATTRRGFFEHVTCTAAQWLAHGPAIVQQQPITRVVLSDTLFTPQGDGLRRVMLYAGISVAMNANDAALLWARRVAGLEAVLCIACGGSGGDRLDCPGCNGTGKEVR